MKRFFRPRCERRRLAFFVSLFCMLSAVGLLFPVASLAQEKGEYPTMKRESLYVNTGEISPRNLQPESLIFGDGAMKMNLRTGEITFTKPANEVAKEFANFVAEHYSAYCDSLRREIQWLRQKKDNGR